MNQLQIFSAPEACTSKPRTKESPTTGWHLLAGLLLIACSGCTSSDYKTNFGASTNWLPTKILLSTGVVPTPAYYLPANPTSSHAAVACSTNTGVDIDGESLKKGTGVLELQGESWLRVLPLPFVDDDASTVLYPKVSVDARGDMTLIVTKTAAAMVEHQMAKRISGSWSPVSSLSGPFAFNPYPIPQYAPAVAMDDQGRGLAAWSQPVGPSTVQLWVVRLDGKMGPPVLLRSFTGTTLPAIHVTANHDGTAFIAWNESDDYYIAQLSSAGWSSVRPLPIDKLTSFGLDCSLLSLEGASQAHILTYSKVEKRVRRYSWSGDRIVLTEDLGILIDPYDSVDEPNLFVNLSATIASDGTILAAWNRGDGIIVARLQTDGLWSEPMTTAGRLGAGQTVGKDRAAILFADESTKPVDVVIVQEMLQGNWQPRRSLGSGYYLRNMKLGTTTQGTWLALWSISTSYSLSHTFFLTAAVGLPPG